MAKIQIEAQHLHVSQTHPHSHQAKIRIIDPDNIDGRKGGTLRGIVARWGRLAANQCRQARR